MEAIGALRSATAGMAAASRQLDVAAATVAHATAMPGPTVVAGAAGAGDAVAGDTDLAGALLAEMLAVRFFGMNAAVARASDELLAATMRLGDLARDG